MNEQQLAAVKQALGALKKGTGWMEHGEIIAALQSIISQDALYKMAEDSRTSGLRLDDWDKIGCVNHDCDKCKVVQEPVAQALSRDAVLANIAGWLRHLADDVTIPYFTNGAFKADCNEAEDVLLATPPAPQPVPVKTYHDGKPWPVAPKPWVGLDSLEVSDLWLDTPFDDCTEETFEAGRAFVEAIEAKLKEKNHDH
jgi:hypothetical protein